MNRTQIWFGCGNQVSENDVQGIKRKDKVDTCRNLLFNWIILWQTNTKVSYGLNDKNWEFCSQFFISEVFVQIFDYQNHRLSFEDSDVFCTFDSFQKVLTVFGHQPTDVYLRDHNWETCKIRILWLFFKHFSVKIIICETWWWTVYLNNVIIVLIVNNKSLFMNHPISLKWQVS